MKFTIQFLHDRVNGMGKDTPKLLTPAGGPFQLPPKAVTL